MKANFNEVAEIIRNMEEANIEIRGIEYANLGCSDYQLQNSFRSIEFYVSKGELEGQCRNYNNKPLSVWVKVKTGTGFYKIIR